MIGPSEPDPTLFVLDTAPILAIARRRGDYGQYIARLLGESDTNAPKPTSGTHTNRAADAEKAAGRMLTGLKERPKNKDEAFNQIRDAVQHTGPLSRKAFDRAWAGSVSVNWKRGGRRKKI